jgi:hypothetical protein
VSPLVAGLEEAPPLVIVTLVRVCRKDLKQQLPSHFDLKATNHVDGDLMDVSDGLV